MLQQVCEYIHNYFIPKDNGKPRVWQGDYTIASGVISPAPPLKQGQRFLIAGSDLNDGVYTYYADAIMDDDNSAVSGLRDEVFSGSIAAMAVPPAVMALVGEISEWEAKYGAATLTPYLSEKVDGVYSYEKAMKTDGKSSGLFSWQDIFSTRLDRWRKPCP